MIPWEDIETVCVKTLTAFFVTLAIIAAIWTASRVIGIVKREPDCECYDKPYLQDAQQVWEENNL